MIHFGNNIFKYKNISLKRKTPKLTQDLGILHVEVQLKGMYQSYKRAVPNKYEKNRNYFQSMFVK